MTDGVKTLAAAFLKSESTSVVGSAEYANKLESVGQILAKSGKGIEHLSSYEPEALVPVLLDLVLELHSKNQENKNTSIGDFETFPMLDLDDADTSAEIDSAYEMYPSIDTELAGKLRTVYTAFFFEGKTMAQRYGIALRLLDACGKRGIDPEPLWLRLKAKGGLLDDY